MPGARVAFPFGEHRRAAMPDGPEMVRRQRSRWRANTPCAAWRAVFGGSLIPWPFRECCLKRMGLR